MDVETTDRQLALIAACGLRLQARSWWLAVAESCTGGGLGDRLTDVPGSSAWFLGGIIAYADALKIALLGVPAAVIAQHGAVSAETATAMAAGARAHTGAEVAIAITGIAGPGGGLPNKPVGTVFIALAAPDYQQVTGYAWPGNRRANKATSVQAALDLLAAYLVRET